MDGLEITCEALYERLAAGDAPRLLDVREPWEHATAALAGSVLMPMGELQRRWQELDPDAEWVVYCHHGVRSLYATAFLRQEGLSTARSLRGGIDAWSLQVDPDVPRY